MTGNLRLRVIALRCGKSRLSASGNKLLLKHLNADPHLVEVGVGGDPTPTPTPMLVGLGMVASTEAPSAGSAAVVPFALR